MDNGIDPGHRGTDLLWKQEIPVNELESIEQVDALAATEVVENNRLVSGIPQCFRNMRADVARPADHKNTISGTHGCDLLLCTRKAWDFCGSLDSSTIS